ncbi:MAG: transporter [Hyphomicrobiales bacterium]|nr:MAG: transporter [Hyphomicrobiales bacterium]
MKNTTILDNKDTKHRLGRIEGLDFARFLAFLGMVLVNFKIVMLPSDVVTYGAAGWFYDALEGRAAALFVILAGIGLGLTVKITQLNYNGETRDFTMTTLKRGMFLFGVGMLNSIIFEADILHYYGIYFLFAAFLAPLGDRVLKSLIIGLLTAATIMLLMLNFDEGWDWKTYEYAHFFSLEGGLRNLFYNGWHPVIPWLGFLLFGVLLSRLNLTSKQVQIKMIVGGLAVTLICYSLSSGVITSLFNSGDEQLMQLIPVFSIGPVPATILYMISASASACAVIAASIIFCKKFAKFSIVKALGTAGRQTLTLYILHIYLGMGLMEMNGMAGKSTVDVSLLTSVLFVFVAAVGCNIWSQFFKAGALETVMRKITG